MEEVLKHHKTFPYVFEVLSMVLKDSAGNRNVRIVHRFSRIETDGTWKFLLVFENPAEIRGTALRTVLHASGDMETSVYLPAFGKKLIDISGAYSSSLLLGTDFSIEDFIGENFSELSYSREPDHKIDQTTYFVVRAEPKSDTLKGKTGFSLRRHFIRKDIFYIVRTDYYDGGGRLVKSLTHHDLNLFDGEMWDANMILMDNIKMRHKTLLKIIKRVFAEDYVSKEIFTNEWLLENRHFLDREDLLFYAHQDTLKDE